MCKKDAKNGSWPEQWSGEGMSWRRRTSLMT
jgi:hypothetical protein